jgi:arginine-tRNA-protein transferase
MNAQEELEVLLGMGFEEGIARATLAFAGNLDDAVAMLLSDNGVEGEDPLRRPVERPARPLEFAEERCSALKLYGTYVAARCGYCKGLKCSSNFAFTLLRCRPEDYESLLGLGFSLSGSWCYKPLSDRSCCALYAIRIDVARFVESEANAKTRRKMANFLARGGAVAEPGPVAVAVAGPPKRQKKQQHKAEDAVQKVLSRGVLAALARSETLPRVALPESVYVRRPATSRDHYAVPLAALVHLYRGGAVTQQLVFEEIVRHWHEPEYGGVAFDQTGYLVFRDEKLRGEKREEEPQAQVFPPQIKPRELRVELEEARFSEEKWRLYKQYQEVVHKDDSVDEASFRKYYCSEIVMRHPARPGDHPFGLGMAHMTYRIDGVLVGCCALMFCPNSLVSLYFFWDTLSCKSAALGHYSQLCELELAKQWPNLRHYNLMFHCPTSAKMDYKMKLAATEILCPFTRRYQPYDARVRALIEEKGFTRLEADPAIPNLDLLGGGDRDVIYDVPIQLRPGMVHRYAEARDFLGDQGLARLEERLLELCSHVGELRYKLIVALFDN